MNCWPCGMNCGSDVWGLLPGAWSMNGIFNISSWVTVLLLTLLTGRIFESPTEVL